MIKLFLFIIVLSVSIPGLSQQNDSAKLEKTVAIFNAALVEGSKESLDQLTADGLTYGHSSGRIENKLQFIEELSSGRSDFVDIKTEDQQLYIKGNTGIVRHLLTASTNDRGVSGTVRLHVLLVWQKENNEWKLLARQAVKAIIND